jgi:hypothetical protein
MEEEGGSLTRENGRGLWGVISQKKIQFLSKYLYLKLQRTYRKHRD